MSTLFFYTSQQFFNFKSAQTAAGFEFLSMSKLLSSQKIDGLDSDQQYFVDISSLVGFVKTNDSQMLNFEQLFGSFGENITFICDKVYEADIKYLFRYIFDDFSDIEAESEDVTVENEEMPMSQSKSVKKITDLNDSELDSFFESFDARLYGHERLRKNSKNL